MYENSKQIKSYLLIGIVSYLMGYFCYSNFQPSINRVELLYTEVSNTGEVGFIKSWEIQTWQTSIKPDMTIKQDGGSDRSNQSKDSNTTEPTNTGSIRHTWFPADSIVQDYVNYAYSIWWENLLLLCECENWWRDLDLQSRVQQKYGREKTYWLCQLHIYNYPDIDYTRFLTDYKYQLDVCWQKRSTWTPFYWPTRIIKGQYCYNYVRDRFIWLK